jgi:hypothetical protein
MTSWERQERYIKAWQASGISQATYCRENGLNARQLSVIFCSRHDSIRICRIARPDLSCFQSDKFLICGVSGSQMIQATSQFDS